MKQSEQSGSAVSVLLLEALRLHNEGKLIEAKANYTKILLIEPANFDALHLIGVIYRQSGEPIKGIEFIKRSIKINSTNPWAYTNLSCAYDDISNKDEALKNLNLAIQINPNEIDAIYNKVLILKKYGDLEDALLTVNNLIKINPNFDLAYYLLGEVFYELNSKEQAIDSYLKSITLNPNNANAYFKLANIYLVKRDFEKSLINYNLALNLNPNLVEAHSNKGNALKEIGELNQSILSYTNAITLEQNFQDAYYNRAITYNELKIYDKSLDDYNSAIKLNPKESKYYINRASLLQEGGQFEKALNDYNIAYKLNPNSDFIYGSIIHLKSKICKWENYQFEILHLKTLISVNKKSKITTPFTLLSVFDNPVAHLNAAKIWVDSRCNLPYERKFKCNSSKNSKIRIGYYSSDFHQHATAYLISGLFEEHSTIDFEFYIFSYGTEVQDKMHKKIVNCFDNFIDVKNKTDKEIADLSNSLKIDIAVDLKGFTQNSRPGIFANSCAPIQVSYLGYPGTMGASYIDYIVADKTVIPTDSQQFYSEKIVYLPHCYQVNDSKKKISNRRFSKAEVGLPESGFVFCCFNNNYKITPSTFDGWMRLLKAVPDSVLWLYEDNPTASRNLCVEAELRGVNSARLIFARRLPLDEHLARHRLADLFLDTFPFNAHTTASDALWAGLPLLTLIGDSFAARVAASLLNTIGLRELIAKTQEEYEAKAIELATNLRLLKQIKQSLSTKKLTSPLFNTKLYAKNIEAAYKIMYERYQNNLPSDHLYIEDVSTSTASKTF